jgi:hypothetical protein
MYAGAVYVFVRNGNSWTLQQKITADDSTTNTMFGWSVAVHGERLVAGAPGARAAYVFGRSGATWSLLQKLVPSGSANYFGSSVGMSSNTVAVGGAFTYVYEAQGTMPPPEVSFDYSESMASESGVQGTFVIKRYGDTNSELTVRYSVSGTASSGVDYDATNDGDHSRRA